MSILKTIRSSISKPHPAGHPFLLLSVAVTLLGYFTPLRAIRRIGWLMFGFNWFFFRNPTRIPPDETNIIVAPADGIIAAIEEVLPPTEFGMEPIPVWRISTFLSVLNVHIQRIPAKGKVTGQNYIKGKFLNASLDKASEQNERNAISMTLPDGKKLVVVQIAGLIARRIVCNAVTENDYNIGDIYGLIRFGSRVDLYLPQGCVPSVKIGQTMIGGETVVAQI